VSYYDEEEEEGREKRGKEKGLRTPPTGAGLIRFYDEELSGIKVGPRAVVIISVMFVMSVLFAWIFF